MVTVSVRQVLGIAVPIFLGLGAAAACGGDAATPSVKPAMDGGILPSDAGDGTDSDDAASLPTLKFTTTCDLAEGDTELAWEAIPGAAHYRITWPDGETVVTEPAVRLTGPPKTYALRAELPTGAPAAIAEWRSITDTIAGDTLLLRGLRNGEAAWEPISCIERRMAAKATETLASNASPSTGPGTSPSSLVGAAFLLPRSAAEPIGDLLAATTDGVLRFGSGSPWAPFPVALAIPPVSPGALFIDRAASIVARSDGALVRQSHFLFAADAAAPDVLTSTDLDGRRVFGVVADGDGAWVLAEHNGTPAGKPSRALHFAHFDGSVVADASVELPDDSASPDFRFDPEGFAIVNRNGSGGVHAGTTSSAAITWSDCAGALTAVRSLRSSALYTFVVDGEAGNRVTGYPRLDFRTAIFATTVPDATDLDIAGFTERYRRPALP